MRTLPSCHILLLCPLLLVALLGHTQQARQDTPRLRHDTLLLHFAVDKYDIQPADAVRVVGFFQDSLFDAGKLDSVVITGYTDKTGTVAHNQHLSAQRAAAAGDWLRAQLSGRDTLRWRISVPLWRLIPGGIAPTPQRGDSDNRRAEIVIGYHPDPPPPASASTPSDRQRPSDLGARPTLDSTQPTVVIAVPINFIVDTPIPTDATRLTLPGYIATLRKYANHRMEIDGFCNSLTPLSGPNDPLFILSVKRAKFIYDCMVDAGFDPARLTYKGMGNASPINPDPVNLRQMDANMRVEIKIY
jgi:outer membrane protein OmpA-like peptidoglycan-associated protein